MSRKFNYELWKAGQKVEDNLKPKIDKLLNCNFKRNDNIFDVLDFHDEENKKIVEVKGRNIPSNRFETTIITCNKITEGLMRTELGFKVYYFFVFTDKTLYLELNPEDCEFTMKLTGTHNIPHYLIPISKLTELKEEEISLED